MLTPNVGHPAAPPPAGENPGQRAASPVPEDGDYVAKVVPSSFKVARQALSGYVWNEETPAKNRSTIDKVFSFLKTKRQALFAGIPPATIDRFASFVAMKIVKGDLNHNLVHHVNVDLADFNQDDLIQEMKQNAPPVHNPPLAPAEIQGPGGAAAEPSTFQKIAHSMQYYLGLEGAQEEITESVKTTAWTLINGGLSTLFAINNTQTAPLAAYFSIAAVGEGIRVGISLTQPERVPYNTDYFRNNMTGALGLLAVNTVASSLLPLAFTVAIGYQLLNVIKNVPLDRGMVGRALGVGDYPNYAANGRN
ncbi:hypothetical protein DID80_00080 [Candidatus Marinamargulisbacteria bacterium SCGC AAA071-K20]|nr:hypothetical protein DID80_00080 [Candidatus Marinamargulisbacteria bacterium SCGC AAA071-K20]